MLISIDIGTVKDKSNGRNYTNTTCSYKVIAEDIVDAIKIAREHVKDEENYSDTWQVIRVAIDDSANPIARGDAFVSGNGTRVSLVEGLTYGLS